MAANGSSNSGGGNMPSPNAATGILGKRPRIENSLGENKRHHANVGSASMELNRSNSAIVDKNVQRVSRLQALQQVRQGSKGVDVAEETNPPRKGHSESDAQVPRMNVQREQMDNIQMNNQHSSTSINGRVVSSESIWAGALEARRNMRNGSASSGVLAQNTSWALLDGKNSRTTNVRSYATAAACAGAGVVPGQITAGSVDSLAALAESEKSLEKLKRGKQQQQQQQKPEEKQAHEQNDKPKVQEPLKENDVKNQSVSAIIEPAHALYGPLNTILKSGSVDQQHVSVSASHEGGTVSINIENPNSVSTTNDIKFMDTAFLFVACFGISVWVFLVSMVYTFTPPENFMYLGNTEHYVGVFCSSLIFGSLLTKIRPLVLKSGLINLSGSGIIIGTSVVQVIAILTDISLAVIKTPVLVDPITGARAYPLRWCEWTALSFMMTFYTEGVHVSRTEDLNNSDKDQGSIGADDRQKMPFQRWKHGLKLLQWPLLMGSTQGLSTLAGLMFPYCSNFFTWMMWMVESVLLYLCLFPRLYYKYKLLKNTKKGTSVDEIEFYDRVRLSYRLLATCTSMWTILVLAYFFGSFSRWFVPEGHFLKNPSLSFVTDCIIDVLAKALYLDIALDVHKLVFDDRERSSRRLEELRRLMAVVWECSSDVISISVKGQNGMITTMLSPTFHNIDNMFLEEMAHAEQDDTKRAEIIGKMKSKPIIFEMKAPGESNNTGGYNDSQIHSALTTVYATNVSDGGPLRYNENNLTAEEHPSLFSIQTLMVKAWASEKTESLDMHDIHLRNGDMIQCEAKATRLGPNALVVVMRDISERFMCFEAEKRAISESTARQKDAEANRFTRHEVKNGLLASIGLCDSLREIIAGNHDAKQSEAAPLNNVATSASGNGLINAHKYIGDLDVTLRDILDTVLAEAMARDVIHEVYEPKMERTDLISVLTGVSSKRNKTRFLVVTNPSPLPIFLFDPQLLKYIHRNAISNACKYGKKGGVIVTEVNFDKDKNEIEINVINLPGEMHQNLLELGSAAGEAVFAPGKRLHSNVDLFGNNTQINHSSGDGAWISLKCAKTLGGNCSIHFEAEKTTFSLKCPARPYAFVLKLFPGAVGDPSDFRLPENTFGVAIDDSKIQRKLMRRFFSVAGIPESRQVLLGKDADEIRGFTDVMEKLLHDHPSSYFLVIVDENLDIEDDSNHCRTISGSLCIHNLRQKLKAEHEQRMLALVRSANDSASDVAIYNSRAHGFICKAPIQRSKIMEIIAPIWAKRFAKRFPQAMVQENQAKQKSEVASERPFDTDASMSASVDIMQTLEVIDALCIQNQSSLSIRWPVLWEKLETLWKDLSRLDNSLTNLQTLEAIAVLKGTKLPENFLSRWAEIRSKIIRVI